MDNVKLTNGTESPLRDSFEHQSESYKATLKRPGASLKA